MKKVTLSMIIFIFLGLFLCIPLFAQSDPRWERWNETMIMDSTYVEGHGVLEYFLYRVDVNAGENNFMKGASFHLALINSLEENNFIVDYNSIRADGNRNLSVNVIRLMSRHRANVSVTLLGPNRDGSLTVIINMDVSNITELSVSYDIVTFNIYQK